VASPRRISARSNLSAGILAYRQGKRGLEVLLVHPGGPYWRNKDEGAWSIPKRRDRHVRGSRTDGPSRVRRRTGSRRLARPPSSLRGDPPARGKRVIAFSGKADFDTASLSSNTFEIEWPPRSGRLQVFPEIDRAEWFDLETGRSKILSGQIELIERLEAALR
jgi:predicted NUDIX family NTP pyrophosphohydrolase